MVTQQQVEQQGAQCDALRIAAAAVCELVADCGGLPTPDRFAYSEAWPLLHGAAARLAEDMREAGLEGPWAHSQRVYRTGGYVRETWRIYRAAEGNEGDVQLARPEAPPLLLGASQFTDPSGKYGDVHTAGEWAIWPDMALQFEAERRDEFYGEALAWPFPSPREPEQIAAIATAPAEFEAAVQVFRDGLAARLASARGEGMLAMFTSWASSSAEAIIYCGHCGHFTNDGMRVDNRGDCPDCGESDRFVYVNDSDAAALPEMYNEFRGPGVYSVEHLAAWSRHAAGLAGDEEVS